MGMGPSGWNTCNYENSCKCRMGIVAQPQPWGKGGRNGLPRTSRLAKRAEAVSSRISKRPVSIYKIEILRRYLVSTLDLLMHVHTCACTGYIHTCPHTNKIVYLYTKTDLGPRMRFSWLSARIPWFNDWPSALGKNGHCNNTMSSIPALRRWRQHDPKFKIILGYAVSSRMAWEIEISKISK